ncbi:sce7726 family protein [Aliivibrio fischeri]
MNNNTTHAIEIKSDVDNTYTLQSQIDDYYKVFNKVSILISEKHLKNINMLNKNIGVYILKNGYISCKRKAKEKRKLNKRLTLDLLSTAELKSLSPSKTSNRIELINDIENYISFKDLNEITYASLYKKISAIFSLFKNEKIGPTTIHDLSVLEIRQPLI